MLAASMAPSVAAEENPGLEKYRNYLPKQIISLSEDVKNKEVPTSYLQAASLGSTSVGIQLIKRDLNGLMYQAVSDYEGSIKAFQADIGEKQTGILTVGQINELENRYKIQNLTPAYVTASLSVRKSDDYAHVTGVQVMLDEKIAWPVNQLAIRCYKSQNYCMATQLIVDLPKVNSFSYQYNVNEMPPDYYKITAWTENTIEATPAEEPAGRCRTTNLSLNFTTKEYYFITKNLTDGCEVMGQKIPKLEKPRTTQIIDGWKTIHAIYADMRKSAYNALSSSFRAELDKADAKSEKECKHTLWTAG